MGETRLPKASAENPDKEVKVAEWADTQIRNEIARLKTIYPPVVIWVIRDGNTAIVKEDDIYVNRVECDTAFDFDRVEQILISEPIPCPVKEGYSYVHVILFCQNIPLILPYFYSSAYTRKGLNLCDWLFINNKLKSTRLNVNQFSEACIVCVDTRGVGVYVGVYGMCMWLCMECVYGCAWDVYVVVYGMCMWVCMRCVCVCTLWHGVRWKWIM